MDIDIKPIDIKIEDNRKYCIAAFYLDHPGILKDIQALRKKWQIEKYQERLLHPKEDFFMDWASILTNERVKIVDDDNFNPQELVPYKKRAESLLPTTVENFEPDIKDNPQWRQLDRFRFDVDNVSAKHKKSTLFNGITLSSVLIYTALDWLFKLAYGRVFYPGGSENIFHLSQMAICFYPESTERDIIEAYRKHKDELIKEYAELHHIDQTFDKEVIINIKRDRKWYWKYLELQNQPNRKGDIYKQLAMHFFKEEHPGYLGEINVNSNGFITLGDKIRHAIKQYKKRLQY